MAVTQKEKRAFQTKVNKFIRGGDKLTNAEMKQQIRLLKRARNEISQDLLSAGTGTFDASVLPEILGQVNFRIDQLSANMADSLAVGQSGMFEFATDQADDLVSVQGVSMTPFRVDDTLLNANVTLTGELIRTVPQDLRKEVGNQISLGMARGDSVTEVVKNINNKVFKQQYWKTERIVRTEMMRTQSIAKYQRDSEIVESNPDMLKRWLWSHKPDGRSGHSSIEQETKENPIPFEDPFMVSPKAGGKKEALQFPRDPAGSAENTINCGCVSILVTPEMAKALKQER